MNHSAAVEGRPVVVERPRPRGVGRFPLSDVVGLLVSCLLVVVAFSPVLFAGRTLSTAAETQGTNGREPFPGQSISGVATTDIRPDKGASAWQFEPWAEITHRSYADGELPLWNPYQAFGAPLAANMQSAVFDPLLLAVNLHPTPLVWDLSIIGAFLLGAAAAFVFGRVLGLRVEAAVVTSAAFSLSGWFFLYSNNVFSRAYVYLPLLFLLVELVLRSRRLLPVLLLGVAVAGNLYVGMPEASFMVLGTTAAYAAVRLLQERRRLPLRVSVLRLGGAGFLGVLLAAPLLLLFVQYEALSFNVHSSEFAKGSETDQQWGLLNWLIPFFQSPPTGVSASVRNWFGVSAGIAALAAISGRSETRRLHAWLFAAMGAAVVLKVYEFRVFDWVGRLPVLELVVYPVFAPPIASFAFAVLAGIGVHVVWARDLLLRRFLILLAGASVLFVVFVGTADRWSTIASAPRGHALEVWGRGLLFAGMAVGGILVSAWLGRRFGALVLAAAVVVELLVLVPFGIYSKRADPFREPGWMPLARTALAADPHGRVFGLDGKLYPNTAGALGLADVRALDALYPNRYLRYVQTFLAPAVFDRFTGTETPVLFRDNPMFDVLSARVVLSQGPLVGASGLRLVGRDRDTRVYENLRAFPRAWVVHRVHVVEGEDEAFAFLRGRSRRQSGGDVVHGFDPRREAVVERATGSADVAVLRDRDGDCTGRPADQVTVERYSGRTVSLRVAASCSGLLVLPDTYFPGWKATVNGEERAILPTDGAFRGVVVPEGTSTVVFRYEPRPFRAGVGLAAAGLTAFLVIGIAARRRRSGRPAFAEEA